MRAARSLVLVCLAVVFSLATARARASSARVHHLAAHAVHSPHASHIREWGLQSHAPAHARLKYGKLIGPLLAIINRDRELHGAAPLKLDIQQSNCSGRHARHMARQGVLSHDQFPQDICVPHHETGENAGMWGGEPVQALLAMHRAMMDEGPCPKTGCSGSALHEHAHFLNLVNPLYVRVGIGVVVYKGITWLTEDFTD